MLMQIQLQTPGPDGIGTGWQYPCRHHDGRTQPEQSGSYAVPARRCGC
jgi:hypothetical protein